MKKYNELIRLAKDSITVMDYMYNNHMVLFKHFKITKDSENFKYSFQRSKYKLSFMKYQTDPISFSMYEKGRTDYISFRGKSDKIIFVQQGKTNQEYDYIDDLSKESYLQHSFLHDDDTLKAIFLLSYYKKYSTLERFNVELSSLKFFIKNIKVYMNAYST